MFSGTGDWTQSDFDTIIGDAPGTLLSWPAPQIDTPYMVSLTNNYVTNASQPAAALVTWGTSYGTGYDSAAAASSLIDGTPYSQNGTTGAMTMSMCQASLQTGRSFMLRRHRAVVAVYLSPSPERTFQVALPLTSERYRLGTPSATGVAVQPQHHRLTLPREPPPVLRWWTRPVVGATVSPSPTQRRKTQRHPSPPSARASHRSATRRR